MGAGRRKELIRPDTNLGAPPRPLPLLPWGPDSGWIGFPTLKSPSSKASSIRPLRGRPSSLPPVPPCQLPEGLQPRSLLTRQEHGLAPACLAAIRPAKGNSFSMLWAAGGPVILDSPYYLGRLALSTPLCVWLPIPGLDPCAAPQCLELSSPSCFLKSSHGHLQSQGGHGYRLFVGNDRLHLADHRRDPRREP